MAEGQQQSNNPATNTQTGNRASQDGAFAALVSDVERMNLDLSGMGLNGQSLSNMSAILNRAFASLEDIIREIFDAFQSGGLASEKTNDAATPTENREKRRKKENDDDGLDDDIEILAELNQKLDDAKAEKASLENEQTELSQTATENITQAMGQELLPPADQTYAQSIFEQSAEAQACLANYDYMPDGIDSEYAGQLIFEAESQSAGELGQSFFENTKDIAALDNKIADLETQKAEVQERIDASAEAEATADSENSQEETLDYNRDLTAEAKYEAIGKEIDEIVIGYGSISPDDLALIAEEHGVSPEYLNDMLEQKNIEPAGYKPTEYTADNTPEPVAATPAPTQENNELQAAQTPATSAPGMGS